MYKNIIILVLIIINCISIFFNFRLYQSNKSKYIISNLGSFQSKVINIVDGDTFDIENSDRVRLAYIDAPEFPKDCYSLQAKIRLTELINNKVVKILKLKKDNFGRILGTVYLNDLNINKTMIVEGYAVFTPNSIQSEYDVELKQAETEARLANRGIWSSACQQKNDNCIIKGNYRSDNKTKIYHLPGCFNYDKIVVNEKAQDQWFCTENEATRSGFVKSNDCP